MSTYICILDFEATCWKDERADKKAEIIEFPSVLIEVNYKNEYKYVSEFRKFVRPTLFPTLTEFCTELTGITQEDVDNANTFEVVFREHNDWLIENVPSESKFFFVTCGHWDLRTMLPNQVEKIQGLKIPYKYKCYSNLKDDFKFFYGKQAGGMTDMLTKLNIKLEGRHHSGIDDCKNITKVLVRMLDDGYEVEKILVNKLK